MTTLPPEMLTGPFTLATSRRLGVTRRVLARHFVRLYPRVWRHRDHVMSHADHVMALVLALPDRCRLTGISRLQQLGLDFGPRTPVRFVIEGDLHLAFAGVFLHRTKRLPPTDQVGVTVEAAFIAYCAEARVIDAIKVGDWLLHHGHATAASIRTLALRELWRAGSQEAVWILEHLDGRSRSLRESEVRALLVFAGLPVPELNQPLDEGPDHQVIADLVYPAWSSVVEYEGPQHQEDREQYVVDLGRYAFMRRRGLGYVQVTHEKLQHPRTMVGEVFALLAGRGYDGPPPRFGERWLSLFGTVSRALGERRHRPATRTVRSAVG